MKINVNIIFKDGTVLHVENAKIDHLMIHINKELTLDTVGFGLYKRQGNVILAQRVDDEVISKHIHILPDES